MEMSIEQAKDKLLEFKKRTFKDDNISELSQALSIAFLTMQNYQLLKISYNDRLKADMVAMLEDLDLQIDELAAYNREYAKIQRLIRDKIDKLKENKNDQPTGD